METKDWTKLKEEKLAKLGEQKTKIVKGVKIAGSCLATIATMSATVVVGGSIANKLSEGYDQDNPVGFWRTFGILTTLAVETAAIGGELILEACEIERILDEDIELEPIKEVEETKDEKPEDKVIWSGTIFKEA